MGTLALFAQSAKGRADWETYQRVVRLADQLWGNADSGLRNALNVSFLEHIDFNGPHGPHAWSLLSARMQRAWRAMTAYNDWLEAGAQGEPPPEADV